MELYSNSPKKVSYKAKDYEILAFYPYPSIPMGTFSEYDNGIHFSGNKKVMQLYRDLMEVLKSKGCGNLQDNKTTIKVQNKKTGDILYVGFKDWYFRIGTGVFQESATEILFDKTDDNIWKENYIRNEQIEHRW